MSEPMPVTTRIITADKASSRSARSSVKSPEEIQVNSVWTICRLSDGMPINAITCITEMTKAIAITPVARPPDSALGRRRPSVAWTRKPANGSSGISASKGSPLQRCERFGVEGFTMPEESNHQRQADSGFSSSHGHHEERDDLAVDLAELAAEGDEREVDGVQHDLHREQQGDQVAAQKHAGRADREQQPRQHQVMSDRHHCSLFRARTTAPTIDAMIRIDVTSNANM